MKSGFLALAIVVLTALSLAVGILSQTQASVDSSGRVNYSQTR